MVFDCGCLIKSNASQIGLTFTLTARFIDLSKVRNKNLNIGDARSSTKGNRTLVVMDVPASSRIRHFSVEIVLQWIFMIPKFSTASTKL